MGVLDNAKEHFAGLEIQHVDVPEWKCKIYWKPWIAAEKQRLSGQLKASGRDAEINARILIIKAIDEKGEALFKIDSLHTLMTQVDPNVVDRVALAIIGDPLTMEQAEKN